MDTHPSREGGGAPSEHFQPTQGNVSSSDRVYAAWEGWPATSRGMVKVGEGDIALKHLRGDAEPADGQDMARDYGARQYLRS